MKLFIFFYRILTSFGIQFYAPVAVFVKDETSAKTLIRELHGLIPVQEVSVTCTDAELAKKLAKYNEEAIVVSGVETQTKYRDLKRFVDLCRYGEYMGQKFEDPVVIVCVGEIPVTVYDMCVGKIVLSDGNLRLAATRTEGWEALVRGLITEIHEHFPIIAWEMGQMKKSILNKGEASVYEGMEVWYAIEVLLRVIVEMAKEPTGSLVMEKISNGICEIEEHWLLEPVEGQFDELFREHLFKSDFTYVSDIRRVTNEDIKHSDETVFFDSEFYYFSESLFKKIAAPMLGVIGIGELKVYLAGAGMLTRYGLEKPKYTSHQMMKVADGHIISPRLMKFNRKKIDRLGHLTLIDVIRARGDR